VLLIVAALEQNALVSLIERAESLGMTALVEVHTRRRCDRAWTPGPRSSASTPATCKHPRGRPGHLRAAGPASRRHVVKIAESGVRGPHDLLAYAAPGADAVLVGEAW
jgi:indole-3-glycerol phosphate synthase